MTEPLADEPELIRRAQSGDAEAYGQLYERYAPPVFRFLCARLDDQLDAEDLTEEVFLRLWRAFPGYVVQEAPFGGFLFRIARNALYDHYRKNRRVTWTEPLDDNQVDHHHLDPAVSVPDFLEHDVARAALRGALCQLKDDQRLVLELRFLGDLSPDEIAVAMNKSAGAVRVLQHRALRALKMVIHVLEQDSDHEP